MEEQFKAPLTPVFCIADISTRTTDALITQTRAREEETRLPISSLYILTSLPPPMTDPSPSQAPTEAFNTPFPNFSLSNLRKTFKEIFRDPFPTDSPYTQSTFIVLDKRSQQDETCIIVSCGSFENEEARCEFDIAIEVLVNPEMGNQTLNEARISDSGVNTNLADEDTGEGETKVLYTSRKWKSWNKY